jgi:aspartate kinase
MPGVVVGVASERDILLLESTAPAAEVLAFLDAHQVAGKQLHASPDSLGLVISRENLHEEARVRAGLAERFGARVHLADDCGALSVVGAGINGSFENVRRGTAALEQAGIRPRDAATSSFRITWTVDRARLDEAVRLMHAMFLEGAAPLVP